MLIFAERDCTGRRLCFLRTDRRTLRYVVAVNGRERCVSLEANMGKERLEVVGRRNGYGIIGDFWSLKEGHRMQATIHNIL